MSPCGVPERAMATAAEQWAALLPPPQSHPNANATWRRYFDQIYRSGSEGRAMPLLSGSEGRATMPPLSGLNFYWDSVPGRSALVIPLVHHWRGRCFLRDGQPWRPRCPACVHP